MGTTKGVVKKGFHEIFVKTKKNTSRYSFSVKLLAEEPLTCNVYRNRNFSKTLNTVSNGLI